MTSDSYGARREIKPRGLYSGNSHSTTDLYNQSNRNLSTDGIEGASPSKFKHMSKRLFVDRKEILSVFGGAPGRYHGYQQDLPVGGTYKTTDSPFWKEKGKLDENIVAGARVESRRDFQAKRLLPALVSKNIFNVTNTSDSFPNISVAEPSNSQKTKILQQRVMRDLKKLKRNDNVRLRENITRYANKVLYVTINIPNFTDLIPIAIHHPKAHTYGKDPDIKLDLFTEML